MDSFPARIASRIAIAAEGNQSGAPVRIAAACCRIARRLCHYISGWPVATGRAGTDQFAVFLARPQPDTRHPRHGCYSLRRPPVSGRQGLRTPGRPARHTSRRSGLRGPPGTEGAYPQVQFHRRGKGRGRQFIGRLGHHRDLSRRPPGAAGGGSAGLVDRQRDGARHRRAP